MTGKSDVEQLRDAVLPIPAGVPESWLDEDCLKRFLRADGGDLEKATTRLRGTLQWRASAQPERLTCTRCATDPFSHYMQHIGFAKSGQPVVYSDIGLARDKSVPGNVEHCIQALERLIAAMPPGIETYIWVSDFHGFSLSDCDPRMASSCLQLFGQHYPERLGAMVMVEAPYLFNSLYKLLSPYIDPITAKKLRFVKGPTGRGGGPEWRTALAELFDDDLLDWLEAEMTQNRKKGVHKLKSFNIANERENGVFYEDCAHDCRGPASFLQSRAAAVASGRVALIDSSELGTTLPADKPVPLLPNSNCIPALVQPVED